MLPVPLEFNHKIKLYHTFCLWIVVSRLNHPMTHIIWYSHYCVISSYWVRLVSIQQNATKIKEYYFVILLPKIAISVLLADILYWFSDVSFDEISIARKQLFPSTILNFPARALQVRQGRWTQKCKQTFVNTCMHHTFTWECSVMSDSKGWLRVGFI